MHLVFTLRNEQRIEGVVLAVGWRRIRMAVSGQDDAIDLRCDQDGQWTTEYGDRLDFDAVIGIAEDDVAEFFRAVLPNVLVARP